MRPKAHPHLRRNLKKEQILEERFSEIERDNRLLLAKMSYIMRHSTLDNTNTSSQYGHSLNKEQRKRELQKITKNNMSILRRIQQAAPTYDHTEWQEHERVHDEYMRNICEMPVRIKGDEGELDYDEGVDGPGTAEYQQA